MAAPLSFPAYFEKALESIRTLRWVRDADCYPDEDVAKFSGLTTPAVYFNVSGWDRADGSGQQIAVELSCELFIIVDAAGRSGVSKPEIYLRALAADLTQWIDGQTFGLEAAEPAAFINAGDDQLDPRMDDYRVWRLEFSQRCVFGADPSEPTGVPFRQVWFGNAPDTGTAHLDDYTLIYEAKDG